MENPFSKDAALRRQTKAETKALSQEEDLTDENLIDKITSDRDFARFLVDSNPKFQNMDFNKKDFQEIREKYYAYTESKKVAGDLRKVYSREIMKDLGIELDKADQERVFAEMEIALRGELQRDSKNIEISRLKNKLDEYNKLREKIEELTNKFRDAGVPEAMGSEQGMDKLKDREKVAKTAKKWKIPFLGSRNRSIQEARQDLMGNFNIEREKIDEQFKELKAGRKEAESLKGQMDELRQYFLNQLNIADSVIETARVRANEVLKQKVELVRTENAKFDPAEADSMAELSDLQAYTELQSMKSRGPSEEQYMQDLEDKRNFGNRRLTDDEKDKLKKYRTDEQKRSETLVSTADSARSLVNKMMEGQKKRASGGKDYTLGGDLLDYNDTNNFDSDENLVKNLDVVLEAEMTEAMKRAVFTSRTIEHFTSAMDPILKRWEMGQYNNRPKVRNFISETLVSLVNEPHMDPALKVQVKATLYKRGIFKGLKSMNIPK